MMTRPATRQPSQGPGHGGPARGTGRRPPFPPGHELSIRHGAFSERKIAPLAADLIQVAIETVPYLGEESYLPAVQAWARAEARVELLVEYVGRVGLLDDDGGVRPATELLRRLEDQTASLRARLGLDPLSRSRLGRDAASRAVDLAAIELADARRIRLEAEDRIARATQVASDGPHTPAQPPTGPEPEGDAG
jgi:hypothetical protein